MKTQKKVQQHIVYKNKKGDRLPGVTTITGILEKPQLVKWANNLGLSGIKVEAFVDDLASVGTLTHEMINKHLRDEVIDTKEYSQNDIDRANNAMKSYYNWEKDKKITLYFSEMPLISEINQYGGTPDIYCELDGKRVLIDVKTSKAIYDDHFIQLAGYKLLLEENLHTVDKAIILRVGRDETEGFEIREVNDFAKYEEIFNHCLAIYNLRKKK